MIMSKGVESSLNVTYPCRVALLTELLSDTEQWTSFDWWGTGSIKKHNVGELSPIGEGLNLSVGSQMLCDHAERIHGSLQEDVGDTDANRRLNRKIGGTDSRTHIQKQDRVLALAAKAVQRLF